MLARGKLFNFYSRILVRLAVIFVGDMFDLRKNILLLALMFNLSIFVFAQNEYQRTDLWKAEINAFAELDKTTFPKKTEVLFVGSSSIRGWRTLEIDFPRIRTLNRGFGGSHIEDVNFYADQIVFPYKPKLIVFYAGENDLAAGKTIETVFADFKKFVSVVRGKLPKTRLIFISLKPSPSRWEFSEKFRALNALIKSETEKDDKSLYIDVWSPMLAQNGQPKPEIFLGDKLHMNPAGYQIWREALSVPVKKGLKGSFR